MYVALSGRAGELGEDLHDLSAQVEIGEKREVERDDHSRVNRTGSPDVAMVFDSS